MTLNAFKSRLISEPADSLAADFLHADNVHVFPIGKDYEDFKAAVTTRFPHAERVVVVGSGNWRYSLNPKKLLSEFHSRSDIDVAVISAQHYQETWDHIRAFHRDKWYMIDAEVKRRLLDMGRNIYSGYACPSWLPQPGHPFKYQFKRLLNQLSGPLVGYREVKMYFFKNMDEAVDYYKRGIMLAKKELRT